MQSEVQLEAQAALIRRSAVWLATSIVILVAAIAFRVGNWEKDLPRFDEPPVLQVLDLEPLRPMPVVEMVPLAFDVPPSPASGGSP